MAYTPLRSHSHSYSGTPGFTYPTNPNRSTFTFRLDDENAPPDPTMGADAIIPGGGRYHIFILLYSTYTYHSYHSYLLLQAKQCACPSPFFLSNKKALNQVSLSLNSSLARTVRLDSRHPPPLHSRHYHPVLPLALAQFPHPTVIHRSWQGRRWQNQVPCRS